MMNLMSTYTDPVLDVNSLATHLGDPSWAIVDCRADLTNVNYGFKAYEHAHIPGAVHVDLEVDLSSKKTASGAGGRHPLPTPEQLSDLFSRLGIDDRVQVVAYDDTSGHYAARLWWMLRFMGHRAVAVLDGGWSAWIQAGMPVSAETEYRAPRLFKGHPRWDRMVTIDEVLTAQKLVDGRAPERYRGEIEPIDPVAGHIPGAINRPYSLNWGQDGRWRSREELLPDFLEMLGETSPENAVYYCGSGVSACVNLVGAARAGLPEGRLYVGSWSEWSRLRTNASGKPGEVSDDKPVV